MRDIEEQAAACLDDGARELVLVGQDTALWSGDGLALEDLLGHLAGDERVAWIRLLYMQPENVDEAILSLLAKHPKACRYLDMPFQHAGREVLARMGRRGDADTHLALLARARALMPDVSLRSTFIVGFPGETEKDFSLLSGIRERGPVRPRRGLHIQSRGGDHGGSTAPSRAAQGGRGAVQPPQCRARRSRGSRRARPG